VEPLPQTMGDVRRQTLDQNIFRPFRVGPGLGMFLGLKPQAESYSPFGTEIHFATCPRIPKATSVLGFGFEDDDEDENRATLDMVRYRTIVRHPVVLGGTAAVVLMNNFKNYLLRSCFHV
jgi:hypothetical protein